MFAFPKFFSLLGACLVTVLALSHEARSQDEDEETVHLCDDLRMRLSGKHTDYFESSYVRAILEHQDEIARESAFAETLGCSGSEAYGSECSSSSLRVNAIKKNLDALYAQGRKSTFEWAAYDQSAAFHKMRFYGCLFPEDFSLSQLNPFVLRQPFDWTNFTVGQAHPGLSLSYRTLCVRMKDGYTFPISFATTPDRFINDSQICLQSCPLQEMQLFVHENPQQTLLEAVSLDGLTFYRDLPSRNRYFYNQDLGLSCSLAFADFGELHPSLSGQDQKESAAGTFRSETLEPLLGVDHNTEGSKEEDRLVLHLFERDFDPTNIRQVGPGFFPEKQHQRQGEAEGGS